ncbi:hypothetical protein BD324DRAFT_204652 [Kockovaella imperatae]|uniref:Uncharacterized protein n=1 Tax=Kockovaella imperatae TaxID=4999 RepID=A0A1Y1U715_9TREE|nr:hypothetical protein BD324DRAFT_204652 [Kockovaella imperatae]ORX33829.1 hypothetical protein BD324DRAFT_204652 [Kockovaella imperatae]
MDKRQQTDMAAQGVFKIASFVGPPRRQPAIAPLVVTWHIMAKNVPCGQAGEDRHRAGAPGAQPDHSSSTPGLRRLEQRRSTRHPLRVSSTLGHPPCSTMGPSSCARSQVTIVLAKIVVPVGMPHVVSSNWRAGFSFHPFAVAHSWERQCAHAWRRETHWASQPDTAKHPNALSYLLNMLRSPRDDVKQRLGSTFASDCQRIDNGRKMTVDTWHDECCRRCRSGRCRFRVDLGLLPWPQPRLTGPTALSGLFFGLFFFFGSISPNS